jgi:hypothetical protein
MMIQVRNQHVIEEVVMKVKIKQAVAALTLGAAMILSQSVVAADDTSIGKMQETMQQIRQTEDPERRAELLEAHLNEMHAVMGRIQRELGDLMHGLEQQKTETRRVHDHRRTRTPSSR